MEIRIASYAPAFELEPIYSSFLCLMLEDAKMCIHDPKRRFWKVEPTFSECVFEALFKGLGTLFERRTRTMKLPNDDFGRGYKR